VARGAGEPEPKSFAAKNAQLRLPSAAWDWVDVTAQEAADGYLARAVRRLESDANVYVDAYAYVSPTGGQTLAEQMTQLLDAAASDFGNTFKKQIQKARMAGLDGSVAVVRGTTTGGGPGLYLYYGVLAKDSFHHLLVKAFNGAEGKLGAEIDTLRRGYRLLSGGGPEEPAPAAGTSLAEVEAKAGATPQGGDSGAAEPPKQEGNVFLFEKRNFRWTLPQGPEWKVALIGGDKVMELQTVLPGVKEPPRPGMQPDETPAKPAKLTVHMFHVAAKPGGLPEPTVRSPDQQQQMTDKNFDKVDTSKTQVKGDQAVGNHRGSAVQFAGTNGDAYRYMRVYIVHLRGEQFQWTMFMDGDRNVDDVLQPVVKELFQGVEFLETKEGVRGPVALVGVPHWVLPRGEPGDGKEASYAGFSAKRPKDWHKLEVQNPDRGHQLTWEHRSPDGSSYQVLQITALRAEDLGDNKIKDEDLVTKRETYWRQNVDDPVTVAKGKDPWFPANFDKAKGVGYRFSGTWLGVPYVEHGWVVKNKSLMYQIRHQYGGADAEKAAEKAAKAADKFVKFTG
jgi:hypothetical protein